MHWYSYLILICGDRSTPCHDGYCSDPDSVYYIEEKYEIKKKYNRLVIRGRKVQLDGLSEIRCISHTPYEKESIIPISRKIGCGSGSNYCGNNGTENVMEVKILETPE